MNDLRKLVLLTITVVGLCLLYLSPASAEEPRQWTSSNKAFKVSATFVSATETEVRLRRAEDGREIVVPIAKLSTADQRYIQRRLEDKKSNSSAKAKLPSDGDTQLRIEPIDANQIVLHPYGVLPIPEPGFQWSITSQSPPGIQAVHAASEKGNAKPKMNDRVIVEVHPFIPASRRADFIRKRNDQMATEMRRDPKDFVNSTIDDGNGQISNEHQIRLMQFGSDIDACGQYLFLKDKTLVIESMSWVNKGRAVPLAETVLKEIKKDQRWYQEPTIDPQIQKSIAQLIDKVKKCHERNDAKGAFELLMPKSTVAEFQENPGAYRAVVAQFELTGLPMIIEAFKAIDWKTAKYYELEKAVSFEGCPVRFLLVNGQWCMQP